MGVAAVLDCLWRPGQLGPCSPVARWQGRAGLGRPANRACRWPLAGCLCWLLQVRRERAEPTGARWSPRGPAGSLLELLQQQQDKPPGSHSASSNLLCKYKHMLMPESRGFSYAHCAEQELSGNRDCGSAAPRSGRSGETQNCAAWPEQQLAPLLDQRRQSHAGGVVD